ncbi:MAG: hypothetical protein ABH848_01525, partial [Candidatus Omnitrophota bacterium]
KKSLSLTLLVISGLIVLSIASCGGSSDREVATTGTEELKQYAQVDMDSVAEESISMFKTFPIYTDGRSPDNHYIASGYMGDTSDVKIDQSSFETPQAGTTCIKITYSNIASQGARWAGVYWQNPANNWGDRKGGFDLTGATKLSFWAKGAKGGERIEEFKMGGLTGQYPDSDVAGIGPVLLTNKWKQYEIDLRGKDLSYISGGFAWATNLDVNPDGAVFYLDGIKYE